MIKMFSFCEVNGHKRRPSFFPKDAIKVNMGILVHFKLFFKVSTTEFLIKNK